MKRYHLEKRLWGFDQDTMEGTHKSGPENHQKSLVLNEVHGIPRRVVTGDSYLYVVLCAPGVRTVVDAVWRGVRVA